MNRYGYACINMQLSYPQKHGGQERGVPPITTGRSMIKRTFKAKGVDYASELTLNNVKDLDKIIEAISTSKQVTFFNDWYCMSYSSLLIFINKNLWVQESGLDSNPYGYLRINTEEKHGYFNNWNIAIPSRDTNILIRTLENGDKIKTNNSEKKVSELMRAFGLRGLFKEVWPLILAEEEIIWIPGIRKSDTALDFQKNNYSHIITH